MIVAQTPIHHDARILVADEGNRAGEFLESRGICDRAIAGERIRYFFV